MSAPLALSRLPATTAVAAAKVNLALHVVGRREDGYHLLSSLVAFAEDGDIVGMTPSDEDRLGVTGPFAAPLLEAGSAANLVLQALRLARAVASSHDIGIGPVAIMLDKRLPIASGIGGGSADAAAILACVAAEWPEMAASLRQAALRLGADVPMCMGGCPALAEGVGERLSPLAAFARIPCLLVNPGLPVSTPEVFRRLASRENPPLPPIPADGFADAPMLLDFLAETRNDLEPASESIVPEIAAARLALEDAGALFARMSGSGATVFGLFAGDEEAGEAARHIAARHPAWWVQQTRLAGTTTARTTASRP